MRLVHIIVLAALLSGCPEQAKREARREFLTMPDREAEELRRRQAESPYDENGNLRPSNEVVAGLQLPRGLNLRVNAEPNWVYKTGVPLDKLHWYFGARLITSNIRREGATATYTAARIRGAEDPDTRLDVKLGPDFPNLKENLVEIYRRPVIRFVGKPPLAPILEPSEAR